MRYFFIHANSCRYFSFSDSMLTLLLANSNAFRDHSLYSCWSQEAAWRIATQKVSGFSSERSHPTLWLSSSRHGVWLLMSTGRPTESASKMACPKFSPNVGSEKMWCLSNTAGNCAFGMAPIKLMLILGGRDRIFCSHKFQYAGSSILPTTVREIASAIFCKASIRKPKFLIG